MTLVDLLAKDLLQWMAAAVEPRPDGRPPALWSAYEYRFKGCVWGRGERWNPGVLPELPTLYTWLRRHGLKVADEKDTAGGGGRWS